MNARNRNVSGILGAIQGRLRGIGKPAIPLSEELPLRSELFSADQMELYGGILAASHELSVSRGTDRLLARLDENERKLFHICSVLTEAVTADQLLTPAGEWLYDNFYLIEEQIRTAKRHLPKSYSRELPLLAEGASARFPRVYDIALQNQACDPDIAPSGTLAKKDVAEWLNSLSCLLSGDAKGSVVRNDRVFTVSIEWNDNRGRIDDAADDDRETFVYRTQL